MEAIGSYVTTFTDTRGSETTTLTNDGEILRVKIRGIEFSGLDFDSLSPKDASAEQSHGFKLISGCLCSCRIECRMSVPVQGRTGVVDCALSIQLTLGDPTPIGGLDREQLQIVLEYEGRRFAGRGTSGWFENELLEIQAQLPKGVFIKACINCLYSDYSPYGHGLFGCLMCFRNRKAEYLKVKSKMDFWSVHDRYDRLVQETYLCPEFERRVPGTGYRG